MFEEIRNIKSGKRQLRQFGLSLGTGLAIIAGVLFLRGQGCYSWFLLASAGLLGLRVVAPGILRPLQKIWMALTALIGWLATRIILIIIFYLVLTPMGMVAKLLRKDLLDIKLDKEKDSCWIVREAVSFERGKSENQF